MLAITSYETLIQIIVWGLIMGCIYLLLASGLNLIFGVMKVVNFAHGEFMMLGGYVSYGFSIFLGIDPYLSIFISIILVGIIGVITERVCFRRIVGNLKLNELILSIGLIYILQNIMAIFGLLVWGDYTIAIHSSFEFTSISLGIINLSFDWLMIIAITALMIFGFYFLTMKTKIGRAMRATSQNRDTAMLMGINVERINMFTFGIGTALAAIAGTLLAIIAPITPYSGAIPVLKAFIIIILGGLGSPIGAVVGGLTYGLVESFSVAILGATWRDAVGFAILILVLIIKPTGLFGDKEQ